jgi:transglutaminase-like putative cysteine protease
MNLAARRNLRLRLRDLAAAAAFTAVALSGLLPLPVLVLFLGALAASLLGLRPLATQRGWAVALLLLAAVALFGLALRGVMDLVVAAVSFATLVTGHRLLSEPTAATDQQVLLASLLLMAGAAALAGDVWYAFCLLAFGVFACLTLGLAVVEGPVERDEELPLSPVLRQVSVGVALALAGGVAFFVLFPRLSWNVAARRTGPGLLGGTTGMTDRVRLGGGGDIKTNARVVFRARIDPRPRSEQLDAYWVGRRFGVFDGREWRGSGVPRPPGPRVFRGEPQAPVVQRIELLPAYDSATLVGLEQPLIFGPASITGTAGTQPAMLVDVRGEEVRLAENAATVSYTVFSSTRTPLFEVDPSMLEPLTALPGSLDPRVAELAGRIAGAETSPARVARALERWLQQNLEYTLELPGEVEDPLADFLFVRKRGHCEHFATALAVMLRTRGIPSRVVGGFFGGERVGERFLVRAGDAHAWVEAYEPTQGWLTFDATPEAGRSGQRSSLLSQLVDGWERLEELWRTRVVDYSIVDQWNFVRELVRPPRGAEGDAEREQPVARGTPRLQPLAAAVLTAVSVFIAWRRLSRPRPSRHPAAGFLARLERRLDDVGIRRDAQEDVEALARRLTSEGHPLATAVSKATRRYLEARFGGRPLGRGEEQRLLGNIAPEISGIPARGH